jgi:predicted nucleotide-binding protein
LKKVRKLGFWLLSATLRVRLPDSLVRQKQPHRRPFNVLEVKYLFAGDTLARIDAHLIQKLKHKLQLSQSALYKRIDRIARQYTQPRNIAALLLARDEGVNFLRFASSSDLATMQGIKIDVVEAPASNIAAPASAGNGASSGKRKAATTKPSKKKPDSVFVVHGRDVKARQELSAFLRSLHVDVIEWDKALALTKKGSPYIGEVIDAGFQYAQAIVVMFTPDDEAKLKDGFFRKGDGAFEKKLNGQPRQNVLFEAGIAFGKYKDTTVLV